MVRVAICMPDAMIEIGVLDGNGGKDDRRPTLTVGAECLVYYMFCAVLNIELAGLIAVSERKEKREDCFWRSHMTEKQAK